MHRGWPKTPQEEARKQAQDKQKLGQIADRQALRERGSNAAPTPRNALMNFQLGRDPVQVGTDQVHQNRRDG